MNRDWFRKTSWSDDDAGDFFKRLNRARVASRPQYLRIQALTLYEQGSDFDMASLSLLDLILERYEEDIQLVPVLGQKAACLERLGRLDDAVSNYRLAVAQMRKRPSWQTHAWLDLAWLIASKRMKGLYQEALELLKEFGSQGIYFPIMTYRMQAVRAIVLGETGEVNDARIAAKAAIHASRERSSGLNRHPTAGVVTSVPDEVQAILLALSGDLH